MAITLTGAGGLFTRLGLLAGGLNDINAMRGAAATARVLSGALMTTRVTSLFTAFAASPESNVLTDQLNTLLAAYQASPTSFLTSLQTLADSTIIKATNDNTPLSSQTRAAAMAALVTAMTAQSATVNASLPAAGTVTAVGSPTGTPSIVLSVKNGKGQLCEYALPETVTFKCTADAQSGGATARRETLTVTTPAARSDALFWDWPKGTASSKTVTAIDSALDATAGSNLLTNSDFESFTSNLPDSWTVLVGTAVTTIDDSTDSYSGSKALTFIGNGSELTSICQNITGLSPSTQYLVNCWIKCDVVPAAGVLQLNLIDGSNTIINDDAGTANTVSKTLSAATTGYVALSGAFRTPAVLPGTIKIRVRLSTAMSSGSILFIDDLAMCVPTRLYTGGPDFAVFAGATNLIANDTWTSAITNTWGEFQKYFERTF